MEFCINCGKPTIEYVGEAYDDDEYLGSHYECSNCDFRFTISPAEQRDLDDQHGE